MSFKSSLGRRSAVVFALLGALVATGAFAQATGSADFTRYYALGDSLTAGFISGSLVDEVQRVSYPALIHRQTGVGGDFFLPLVSRPGIPGLLDLRSLSPLVITRSPSAGFPLALTLPVPYNNLAVPGATVDDLLNKRDDNGGLHTLILRGIGTQLEQAIGANASFVSLWIGNNDALAAAVSGIVIDDVTLTTLARFEPRYRAIVGALRAAQIELVMATIPSVTSIPYVTTVPAVLVNPATNQPVLVGGQPVPLLGPEGPLVPGRDFVLLPATAELAQGFGIPVAAGGNGQPLSNGVVLSGAEASAINARIGQYNQLIRTVAGEASAALVDVDAIFGEIVTEGIEYGGITYTENFLSGGLFSYDGVHPTTFGYAVIANEFIRAINETYGEEIPPVDLHDYVFGPAGSLGTRVGSEPPAFLFTREAEDQLRSALGIPDRQTLEEMAEQGGETDACPVELGHRRYCRACGPCDVGEGHCRNHGDCLPGLSCVRRAGPEFGLARNVNVCR